MYIKKMVAVAALLLSCSAHAGASGDDLAKCMADSTSQNDRTLLVRWMFTAVSANPAVASMAKVSPKMRSDDSAAAGALFMKLLTDSCKDKTQKALADDGGAAIQQAFQSLGQVAAAEMFASPDVVKAISGMEKYLDKKQLDAALRSSEPASAQ